MIPTINRAINARPRLKAVGLAAYRYRIILLSVQVLLIGAVALQLKIQADPYAGPTHVQQAN